MAKAPKNTKVPEMSPGLAAFAAASTAEANTNAGASVESPVGYVEPTTTGNVQVNPTIKSDADILAESKAARAAEAQAAKDKKAADKAAADAEKAERKAAADKAKADKKAQAEADKAAKAEARALAKKEREERLAAAAEGKTYAGSMLALADRVKQGVYVKSATGQLHSGDELALALDGVSPTDVIRIGLDVLKIEENPYAHLNIGQQSMNLRNRMRGAIKKQALAITDITSYIARNNVVQVTPAEIEARRAEKAARVEAAKAEREAKAEAARKAAAEKAKLTKADVGAAEVVLDGSEDTRADVLAAAAD